MVLGRYRKQFDKFKPLIGVFTFVMLLTISASIILEASLMVSGQLFMAFFFLVFGSFKSYNFSGFVKAFQMYDPLAERSSLYSKSYPFIEIGLGLTYLAVAAFAAPSIELVLYGLTVLVVGTNAAGVFQALTQGKEIQCTCLGDVFNVPMTWVTLVEDLLMVGMAIGMLVFLLI